MSLNYGYVWKICIILLYIRILLKLGHKEDIKCNNSNNAIQTGRFWLAKMLYTDLLWEHMSDTDDNMASTHFLVLPNVHWVIVKIKAQD